jgi:hypothetical protein
LYLLRIIRRAWLAGGKNDQHKLVHIGMDEEVLIEKKEKKGFIAK